MSAPLLEAQAEVPQVLQASCVDATSPLLTFGGNPVGCPPPPYRFCSRTTGWGTEWSGLKVRLKLFASSGAASGPGWVPARLLSGAACPCLAAGSRLHRCALNRRGRVTQGVTSWRGAVGRCPRAATLQGAPAPELPADLVRVLRNHTASTPHPCPASAGASQKHCPLTAPLREFNLRPPPAAA